MLNAPKLLQKPQPQALATALTEALATTDIVSVGLADLDLFGRFNEAHGPEAGDILLTRVIESLTEAVDSSGQVIRFGGDAFVVVLAGVEKEQAFLKLERARAAFGERHHIRIGSGDIDVAATMSVGVAGAPDDATVAPLLIRKATDALYRAKVSGRDRVCLAREEKMVTKTTHYSQGQLEGLSRLSKRMGVSEAELLREALDDLFRKHNR